VEHKSVRAKYRPPKAEKCGTRLTVRIEWRKTGDRDTVPVKEKELPSWLVLEIGPISKVCEVYGVTGHENYLKS